MEINVTGMLTQWREEKKRYILDHSNLLQPNILFFLSNYIYGLVQTIHFDLILITNIYFQI